MAFVLFPGLTQLDLTGPWEVLRRLPDVRLYLVWKTLDPVVSDSGMAIVPTATFETCPRCEVLFVPGGPGQVECMEDGEVLGWLQQQGAQAEWVASVCTGSLLLAGAGLLGGYQATSHWMSRDQLARLGATVVNQRIVVDRNRITGGGVTAGIDMALELAALLSSEEEARRIGLQMEYDPAPPFGPGSPECSELEMIVEVQRRAKALLTRRREATEKARVRLGLTD
ncbi:MAG: DJ-1/PfpI family protein [Bryobacterales bacterium]|nr:DJ-1/PfpI family protein [Bryobacterales bacterium]